MKFLNRVKNRAIWFIKDDSGADLLEWCAIVVFAVVLIGVIKGIVDIVRARMTTAETYVNSNFDVEKMLENNSTTTP